MKEKNLQKYANFVYLQKKFMLFYFLPYRYSTIFFAIFKKLRKFRVVLSSGSHETGSRAKKVTASDSAKPGPHIHIWYGDFYIWGIDAIKFL